MLAALGATASAAQPAGATHAAAVPPSAPVRQLSHPPAPPPAQYSYAFNLVSFKITETRSLHEDTDYLAVAVSVGKNPPVVLPAVALGDLNNGDFTVNATVPSITVPDGDNVTFSYIIVNSGADPTSVRKALSQFLATTGSTEEANPPESVVGRHAGEWQIKNIDFANCDGTVAAAHHGFTSAQLLAGATGGHTIGGVDDNPGNDSPAGCGSNSHYYVTWSIAGFRNP